MHPSQGYERTNLPYLEVSIRELSIIFALLHRIEKLEKIINTHNFQAHLAETKNRR